MHFCRSLSCTAAAVLGASCLVGLANVAEAAVVVSYDATTAAENPTADPAWEPSPETGVNMTLSGGVLQQNNAAGESSSYRSKAVSGLMTRNTSDYTLEFTTKVILDTPADDYYTNTVLIWGDNTQSYGLSLFKNGTTGGLKTGSGTTYGNLANVVSGVDWSTAHQFNISYVGASDQFNVYVDGVLSTTLAANGLLVGSANSPEPFFKDRIIFGDRLTSGGGATRTDWTSVRLYNAVAVPEPAMMGLIGVAAVGASRRRRA